MEIIDFIKAIVKFIQDLVAYFRSLNDGNEDATFPKFSV